MDSVTYDKHGEDGKFTATFESEDFLKAVGDLDLPTTADVADHVGCAHRTALYHLNQLEENGRLTAREAGRAKLWDLAENRE
jgi:predicted ArsR family transcriptional regulator